MPQAKIGVIGGTGLYDIEELTDVEEVEIDTPFEAYLNSIVTQKLQQRLRHQLWQEVAK